MGKWPKAKGMKIKKPKIYKPKIKPQKIKVPKIRPIPKLMKKAGSLNGKNVWSNRKLNKTGLK